MKIKHLILALFLVFMCIVTVNNATEAEAAPAKPSVSTTKRSYAVGAAVTFNINCTGNDATNLWIYRVDGQWHTTYYGITSTESVTFGWAGYYRALVQAWNTDGTNSISDEIYFYIGPPESVTISGNRDVVAQGQSITYTITSHDPGSVHVFHIYSEDANINPVYHEYWTGVTGTSYTFNGKKKDGTNLVPGNYYAQVYTANDVNGVNSNKFWFTVVGGTASVSLTNSNSVSSGGIAHGNVTYTVKVSTAINGSVNNANFKVVASNGSEDLILCTVTNGVITAGTATSVSGSIGTIGKNSSASITLTVNSDNSEFNRNSTYTVQVLAGNVALTGLDAGNGTIISFAASGTHQFKTTNGSASISWTSSIDSGKVVYGKYTYTVTFKNSTNHSVNSIDFTVKTGSTAIVTVSNGTVTANHSCASVSATSLGTVASGGTTTLTITIDATKLSASTSYTFSLAGGGCSATGIYGSTSTYAVSTSGSGSHAITVAGGNVTVAVKSSVSNNAVVKGNVVYTVTFTNGANHSVNNVDFVLKAGSTTLLTITDGAFTKGTGVTTDVSSIGTIASGGTATVKVTVDTTKLSTKTSYTVASSGGACTATGLAVGSRSLTITTGNVQTIITAGGSVTISSNSNIDSGKIVEGTYTYTVTVTNGTNHAINGVDFVVKNGSTTIVTVTDMGVTKTGDYVTISTSSLGTSIAAGGTATLTVTIDTTKLGDGSSHTFTVGNLSSNATGISGTNSTYELTASSNYSHSITVRSGGVTMTWTPSISSGSIVEGTYTYKVTFTNNTNHAITGIDYTIKYGNTTVLSVSNGAVTASGCATANKTSLGDLASGASVELLVTIDTTKLTDGSGYTFTLGSGSSNATGIAGSNSTIELKPSTNSYTHSITVRSGDITVGLTSATVNNKGVAEGDVVYTITLNNGTNHSLNNVVIVLKDSKGNALITVNGGKITINDPTLVTAGGSITDSINANGRNYVISGITVNGKADILDADGQLVLIVESSAVSSDVVGSDAAVAYATSSNTYTVMVRHDVDLLVQAGKDTAITLDKIFAAMGKSGATVYEGITSITGIALSDINGGSASVPGLSISDGKLSVNLSAAYTEFIVKATYTGGEILVPMQITTLSAGEDKTFVLDYGLPVHFNHAQMIPDLRLTGGSFPSITNTVAGYAAAYGDQAAASLKGKFGTLTYDNETFTYTTTSFLSTEDVAYVVVLVGDNQSGKVENVDYVNVYKKISFIPANVIYYEDTLIGSIEYPNYNLEPMGPLNNTGVSGTQNLPTVGNLGFDDGSYSDAKNVELSGESVQKVPVYDTEATIRFTFTGTGFELISRVNAFDAATIIVKVKAPGRSDFDWYPVITRFNPTNNPNCEVYQVPVFRLNEDTYNVHGVYEVEIMGLPMQDYDENGEVIDDSWKISYIYVDGIRVYNPLGNSELTENYGDEKGAQFHNIRDLILAGKGTLADYTESITSFVTGEHHYYVTTDNNWSAAFGGINELGAIGANNEIFVRRSQGNYILVLRVKENAQGTGLLQIGIRDVHEARFDGNSGENVGTSVSYNTTGGWTPLVTDTYSGTEQYYSIDLSKCPTSGEYKVVVLRVDSGFASFTNIKHKNLTFGEIGEAAQRIYTEPNFFFNENGEICSKDEEGNVTVLAHGKDLFELNMINGIMAQSDANNDLV